MIGAGFLFQFLQASSTLYTLTWRGSEMPGQPAYKPTFQARLTLTVTHSAFREQRKWEKWAMSHFFHFALITEAKVCAPRRWGLPSSTICPVDGQPPCHWLVFWQEIRTTFGWPQEKNDLSHRKVTRGGTKGANHTFKTLLFSRTKSTLWGRLEVGHSWQCKKSFKVLMLWVLLSSSTSFIPVPLP